VLVVVGDVRTDEVRRLVEKHFAPLPRAPMHGRIEIVEPAPVAETRIRATHAGRASHLEMLYRSPSAFDRDYPAFAASAHLLASALRRALGGDSAGLVAEDTATEYPYVFRLRFRADSTADLDRVVRLVDAEIERLRLGEIGTLGRAPASHDDSPLTGEDSYRALIPPRRSNLTQLADSLLARETLPWEVSPVRRAELRAAERSVGVVQIVDVMRRWFHPWQRVVGTLVPGPDHRVPRHEIPPLTTPPEPRRRPEPVPERALQPLAPIGIFTMRELLPNGIVIRAAQGKAEDGMHVRLTIVSPADSVRLADRIAADPTLRTARVRASRATFTSANLVSPRPPAESMRTLRSAFRPIARVSQPGASAPASPTGRDTVEQRVFVDSATQVDVAGTLPGAPRGHADRRALELLNYIVGVPSYGGRLGWALSKSGLTYASRASATFGVGAGELAFHATCDTRNTDATIQAIREVIAGVGASGVEAWELREAQAFMLGRALLYGARDGSSPEAVAAALALSEESGVEQLDLPAYSRAYLSVTLDEINRVARTYYRADRLKIVATGAVPRVAEPRIFPPGTFRKLFESHP
jgi:predicted Zn-dependent peptidase